MEYSPFKLFPLLLEMCEPRRKAEWIFKLQWKQINFLPISNIIPIHGTTINMGGQICCH